MKIGIPIQFTLCRKQSQNCGFWSLSSLSAEETGLSKDIADLLHLAMCTSSWWSLLQKPFICVQGREFNFHSIWRRCPSIKHWLHKKMPITKWCTTFLNGIMTSCTSPDNTQYCLNSGGLLLGCKVGHNAIWPSDSDVCTFAAQSKSNF